MRFALAGWLAAAAGAAARPLPVYREYTVPITFALDPETPSAAADLAAPDLAAHRELRDAPAREDLLGKETLLDLGQVRAASARGAAAPVPGKLTPPAAGERRGGTQENANRNWLAGSLALPTLGQTASNTASAVMGRDSRESSRGWLVDEVAKASGVPETPQDQWQQELENPNSYARESASPAPSAADARSSASGPAPLSDSAVKRNAQARNAPTLQDSEASAASWAVRAGGAPAGAARQTGGAEAGGMSQTRQILSELTGAARPDFAALRASLVQGNSVASGGDSASSAARFGMAPASQAGRSAFGVTPSSSGLSWQGGWHGTGLGGSALKMAEPIPAPVVPAASAPRPAMSSGGYKPAWY